MSGKPEVSGLPLSPAELRSTEVRVPRHEAEAPESPAEPPRLTLHTVEKPSAVSPDPTPDVPPSMPSYAGEISAAPALLPISPPARVLFSGYELEPFDIFRPDARKPYNDRTFPFGCVCSVTSGTKGGCGVLIGRRHVLTASHVIDWQALSASVSFVQGGITFASAVGTDVLAYERISDVTYTNADDDYAVIVINTPLGVSIGALGAKTYDSAWDNETADWANIAYAPDVSSSTPVFQTGFFLDEDDFDLGAGRMLITKTGDFVKGMSGSPVYGIWADGPSVVGVTSAGGSGLGNFNALAGGSNLTRLVSTARARFP
jgi:V8-like Glu-specific endopeptidase